MLSEKEIENNLKIFWINIFGFFISLHYAVIGYSASTFLATLLHQENIWLIYSISSFVAVILNFSATNILRKVNVNKLLTLTSLLATVNLIFVAYSKNIYIICLEFILFEAIAALLFTLASVILEEFSKNSSTGGIRGKYSAIMSFGYLLAPFLTSFFISNFGIVSIFTLSAFFGFCSLFVFYNFIRLVPKIIIQEKAMRNGLKKLFVNKDLSYITIAQFGITTFYTLIVIYLPFKMEILEIPFTTYLSVLLPIALTPFLFMPPLLGHLEDKMKDEKEILIISYIGLIVSIALIAITTTTSLFIWAMILFFSRMCASSAEISTNSYLYKKIHADDVAIISVFLSAEYLATILFTPIFSFLLFTTDIKTLFLSVSFFLCFVLVLVSKIHDTKNYEKHQTWQAVWKRSKARSARRITS